MENSDTPHEEKKNFRGRGWGGHNKGSWPHTSHYQKNAPENAPKESWYYKYYMEPFPKREHVEITLETVIPEIKPKDQLHA